MLLPSLPTIFQVVSLPRRCLLLPPMFYLLLSLLFPPPPLPPFAFIPYTLLIVFFFFSLFLYGDIFIYSFSTLLPSSLRFFLPSLRRPPPPPPPFHTSNKAQSSPALLPLLPPFNNRDLPAKPSAKKSFYSLHNSHNTQVTRNPQSFPLTQ